MTEQVINGAPTEPRDLADWLLARGRHWVTSREAAELLDIPHPHVSPTLARWQRKGRFFSPSRGLYVAIPPEFRLWGAVPASHFIDPLMKYLGHPYYVCRLSAAEAHGYAHQRPQVFQVMTTANLRDREFGRVRIGFSMSKHVEERATVELNTPTGMMRVSTVAATVLDLVERPGESGSLSNVATIIGEMLDDGVLDISQIVASLDIYPTSVAQRTGLLLDTMSRYVDADIDTDPLREVVHAARPVLLDATASRAGELNARWNVQINENVEPDL